MSLYARTVFSSLCAIAFASSLQGAEADSLELAKKAAGMLKAHCYRCHGQDGANEGGFNFALDRRQLVNRGKIVPGDPAKSKIYKRLISDDDPMPPEEEKVRPSKEEIALIQKWIAEGAADFGNQATGRGVISLAKVVTMLRADLDQVAERNRRYTRYFALSHLHNAGLSADELQSFRHGLAKLVNSLSWGPRIVVPKAIANAALAHINALRKKGVVFYPVFASSNDREASEAAEVSMRSASLVTSGQYLLITNDSGVGDSHAEPHIPYYHVEKLNQLMIRMITGELAGKRTDPDLQTVIRTVGSPPVRGRQ